MQKAELSATAMRNTGRERKIERRSQEKAESRKEGEK
jgi:hypothetical protein